MTFVAEGPCPRTRIKFCGLTREADVDAAVALGVDALGFVFWPGSPRVVSIARARALVERVPATVATVGLFVDAARADVDAVLAAVPLSYLQFHGDEPRADCAGFGVPYVKAARVAGATDLLAFEAAYPDAAALLLDAPSAGYGGSGKVFDWSLVPSVLRDTRTAPAGGRRVVLSGGLNAANVADAIARIAPATVDTSSGIEVAKGIKDADRMRDFVAAVRAADRRSAVSPLR